MKKLYIYILMAFMVLVGQHAWAAKAINFELTDTKGKLHKLSDYRGKWVLINFWAPWCPRCWMEFPLLNDLDARNDVVVLGVAMDYGTDQNSVLTYANRYNLRYPTVMAGNRHDQDSPSHQVGPVDFYPTSYLYAPDGELVMFIPGVVSKNKLTAFMDTYVSSVPATALADSSAPVTVQSAPVAGNVAAPSPVKPATIKKHSSAKAHKKKTVTVY